MAALRKVVSMGVLATLAAACGTDFEPASLLTAPRLVGVVAEPPEIAFDGVSALTAVVTEADAVTEATFAVCPVSIGSVGGYACASPELPLPATGLTATLDAAPFEAFLATLANDFGRYARALKAGVVAEDPCLAGVLAERDACGAAAGCDAAAGEAAVACLRTNGLDATVRLTLRFGDAEPFDSYKRVRLRDVSADHPANRNPRLLGVRVAAADSTDDGVTLVAGGTLEVEAGRGARLEPLLEDGSIETWSHDGRDHTELVSYSWFTTAGSLDYGRSTAEVPDVELSVPARADDDWAPLLHVWVVARDDRYGTDALTFSLTVVDGGATP